MNFKIHILGVGKGLSRKYHHTSFVAEAGRQNYTLVECPGEIPQKLTKAGIPIPKVNHVILSHLHADHAGGIQDLIWQKTFPEGGWEHGPKLHIYSIFEVLRGRPTPHGFQEGLWGALAPAMAVAQDPRDMQWDGRWYRAGPERYYIPHELDNDGKAYPVNNLEARVYRTKHTLPTMAVKLSHKGRTLGYSADTLYDPRLIEWLSDSDLILHETGKGIHTDPAELAKLPKDIKRKMRLIHYPDDFPGSKAHEKTGIQLCREGKTYEV
jgi:ribonuclease BN (tRNA processing enzyme)